MGVGLGSVGAGVGWGTEGSEALRVQREGGRGTSGSGVTEEGGPRSGLEGWRNSGARCTPRGEEGGSRGPGEGSGEWDEAPEGHRQKKYRCR